MTECADVRCGVIFGGASAPPRCPLYPDERTSPTKSVKSEKCQDRTHAPQQQPLYSVTSSASARSLGWPMGPCRRFFPVRIILFRLRLLPQLIAQLPACRGRQRQDPRRYRHHLKGDAPLRRIHSVYAGDNKLIGGRTR